MPSDECATSRSPAAWGVVPQVDLFSMYRGFLLDKSEITPLMYSLKRQSDKSSVIPEVLNQNEMHKEKYFFVNKK